MTKCSMFSSPCPHCNKDYDKNVVDELDEESLDLVMGWKLFRYTCPHCNKDFLFKHYVIYRDNKKKFVVGYAPDAQTFVNMIDMFAKEQESNSNTIYRIVPGSHIRFIEKVGMLTAGLNDIVAEVYKEILYMNIKSEDIKDVLFEFDEDCNNYSVAVIREGDSFEYYDYDSETVASLIEDVKARGVIGRANDYVVNRDLALKVLYSEEDLEPLHIAMLKELNAD